MKIHARIATAVFVGILAIPVVRGVQATIRPITPVAKVDFAPIDEGSGIVKSGRFKDTYWVHNDSGDKPRFFAIRESGAVIQPSGTSDYQGILVEGATNRDWEDITRLGRDLVLSDLGNNGNARKDLTLYFVEEPDPAKTTTVKVKRALKVAYPDQTEFPPSGIWSFDCEAVFALRGKIYVITKNRINSMLPAVSASLYRLDTTDQDRVNVLTKLDTAKNLGGWVTGADVSPDGKTLAVLTQAPSQSVWLFSVNAKGDRFLTASKARRLEFSGAKQCEAVGFADNETLLITNEQRDIYRLKVRDAASVQTVTQTLRKGRRIASRVRHAIWD